MQKILKPLILIGAMFLFLSPVIAHAQEEEQDEAETIEQLATFTLGDEIRAGKVTEKQAINYARCVQKDFLEAYVKSPEINRQNMNIEKKYGVSMPTATGRGDVEIDAQALKNMNTKEKTAFVTDIQKATKALEPLQDQAEERCMKKLGVKVPIGKIWGRHLK